MEREQNINDDELYFTINQVAKQIGVVPATIRNWEKHGLFVARRTESGYRIYSMNDIERLRSIKTYSKDENISINAIRKMYVPYIENSLPRKADSDVEVSKKLISQKWKDYRLNHGYLLEDVAREIDISTSYLSKIENGQANVSYDILQRLAAFYGESILYYVNDSERENHLVRKGEGESFSIGIDGISIESVSGLKKQTLSSMIYTVEPGSGRFSPSSHSGEEFIHLLSGKIQIKVGDEEYQMKAGDSLSFRSLESHSWFNNGRSIARILWVYTPLVQG